MSNPSNPSVFDPKVPFLFEITTWSDNILRQLADEEAVSSDYREIFLNELLGRQIAYSSVRLDRSRDNLQNLNRDQLALLNIKFPPKKGWLDQLHGKPVSKEVYAKLTELAGK